MVQGFFGNKNLNSFFIFFVCLFVSIDLKAESVDITKLRNSVTFTETFIDIQPKADQTPFQALTSKIEEAGYNLNSSVPENMNGGHVPDDIRSFLELIVNDNVERLVGNNAMIEAYKADTKLPKNLREENIRNYEALNKKLNKGLEEIKSQYGAKFKDTVENKIKYLTDVKCEIYSDTSSGCTFANPKTLDEIKHSRLNKNSVIAQAFSQGALKGEIDPKLFTEDQPTQESNTELQEKVADSVKESIVPKTKPECIAKSLDAYKEKIKKLAESDYVAFVSQNSTAPCSLFRLSYTVKRSPFKRQLLEGSYFDFNGKAVTLDQKSFDEILRSWNMLNGAKSAKANEPRKAIGNPHKENKSLGKINGTN